MATTNSKRTPGADLEGEDRETRRTVIPTPRSNGIFSGWGVRF